MESIPAHFKETGHRNDCRVERKSVTDPYAGREQTRAKHFILRGYLQEIAFKVLTFSDITYIDGFSGPWETKTESFSDSSFMIAISVLQDAQKKILERTGKRRRIRCFFSENDAEAFVQLQEAVAPFNKPNDEFEIKTYFGNFVDAIAEIRTFVGSSFPLIFIDPTGWTGYPFDRIKPLFMYARCEVLINFIYEFVNRFAYSEDEGIIASLNPILGGPGWRDRLDTDISRGPAVEKLFRETLKSIGDFRFVISTKIDKSTADRPHFFIIYGTKSPKGLIAFRDIEYKALREHLRNRANAKERKREEQLKTRDLFPGHEAEVQEATLDEIIDEQKKSASAHLMTMLETNGPLNFSNAVASLLQPYMLRETNVKDICVELARVGKIENTWGGSNRKPRDGSTIKLRAAY